MSSSTDSERNDPYLHTPDDGMSDAPQSVWLEEMSERIRRDYTTAMRRYQQSGGTSNQEAGHLAEDGWAEVLTKWLPPQYEVGKRKYIVADSSATADQSGEIDLVVFHPSYPPALRQQTHVLAARVVAAFSIKMTLDASALREAGEEAAGLRRLLKPPAHTVRDQLIAPILYGVLAHRHSWNAPGSKPIENIERTLGDLELAQPREAIDVLCVETLACWSRLTAVLLDHLVEAVRQQTDGAVQDVPHVQQNMIRTLTAPPVGVLVAYVINRFARFDPTVQPIADGMRGILPTSGGQSTARRRWALEAALSRQTLDDLKYAPLGSVAWDLFIH